MKPLLYGYMRVTDDVSDEDVLRRHGEMSRYAEAEGFTLGAVFHEHVPELQSAFEELVRTLQGSGAHHVIVPSMRDLALSRPLQTAMLVRMEYTAGADVYELDTCDE